VATDGMGRLLPPIVPEHQPSKPVKKSFLEAEAPLGKYRPVPALG